MTNILNGFIAVLATLMFCMSIFMLIPEGNWLFLAMLFVSGVLLTLALQGLKDAE
jgi:uncharacterized membrane protein YjjP (DUF1212 family)